MPIKKSLRKEIIQWGIMISIIIVLYLTGLHTEVIAQIQRVVISTGMVKANVDDNWESQVKPDASYEFSLKTLEGTEVHFSSFKGKTVFVNIWATWCAPCIAELPSIQDLYNQMEGNPNIKFVILSVDDDTNKPIKFIERKKYSFPVYVTHGAIPEIFKTTSIPTTFVISPQGKVVLRHEGMADYNNEKFIKFLKRL